MVRYLLDTNVISDVMRPVPNEGLIAWFAGVAEVQLYLSTMTIAEISQGIHLLPQGKRRERLEAWSRVDIRDRYQERILAIDSAVALACGELAGIARRRGQVLGIADGFIAATALVHGLTLVSRNIRDFTGLEVELVNPFTA